MDEVTEAAPSSAAPPGDAFAALAAQADMIEAGAAPGGPAMPAQAADNTDEELLAALTMARLMLAPAMGWWSEFGQVWNDATLRGIAEGGAAVMRKHGWTMGGLLSEWGPYLALIGATAPPAFATYQAMKQRKEAARVRTEQAKD